MKNYMKIVSSFILIAALVATMVVSVMAAPLTQAEVDENSRQEAIKYYSAKEYSPGPIRNIVFNPANDAEFAPREGEYDREKNMPAKAFDGLGAAAGGKGNMPLAKYNDKLLYEALNPYHYATHTNNGVKQIGDVGKGGNGYYFADHGALMTFKLPVDARSEVTLAQLIVTVSDRYRVEIGFGITNPNLSTRPGRFSSKATPKIVSGSDEIYYYERTPENASGSGEDLIFNMMPLVTEIRTSGYQVGAVYVRIGCSGSYGNGGQVRRLAMNYNKDYKDLVPSPPALVENTGPASIQNYSFFMEGNPERAFLFAAGGQGKEGVRERFCDGSSTAVYRFPYDPNRKTWIQIQVMANYFIDTLIGDYTVDQLPRVEAYSTAIPKWYQAADAVKDDIKAGGTGKEFGSEADGVPGNGRLITIEITEEMHLNKSMDQKYVYLRFGDMSTGNGNGGVISWIGYIVDELGALNPGATLDQEKQIENLPAYNTRNPYDTQKAANPGPKSPFPSIALPPLPSVDNTERNEYYASENEYKKEFESSQAAMASEMSQLAIEQSDADVAMYESRDAAESENEKAISDAREESLAALKAKGFKIEERVIARKDDYGDFQPYDQVTATDLPNYSFWWILFIAGAAVFAAGILVQFLLSEKKRKAEKLAEAAAE